MQPGRSRRFCGLPPPPSRFASLDSRRMLRLECEVGERASYALDAEHQRHEWSGPVHVGAETVLAFCGEELNMLARPVRPHPYPALSPSPSLPSPKPSPSLSPSLSLSLSLSLFRRALEVQSR